MKEPISRGCQGRGSGRMRRGLATSCMTDATFFPTPGRWPPSRLPESSCWRLAQTGPFLSPAVSQSGMHQGSQGRTYACGPCQVALLSSSYRRSKSRGITGRRYTGLVTHPTLLTVSPTQSIYIGKGTDSNVSRIPIGADR